MFRLAMLDNIILAQQHFILELLVLLHYRMYYIVILECYWMRVRRGSTSICRDALNPDVFFSDRGRFSPNFSCII